MSNPPIPIGELTNVPAPGSRVNADFHQAIANRVIQRFATFQERDNKWPAATAGNGAMCYLTGFRQLMICDGTGWTIVAEPQQTFVPAWTSVPGVSTNQGLYTRSNGFVDFMIDSTFTGAITGQVTVALPMAVTDVRRYQFGVVLRDVSANTYRGLNDSATNTANLTPLAGFGSGGTEAAANLGAATPFPWAAGDGIQIVGRARMQSRYS